MKELVKAAVLVLGGASGAFAQVVDFETIDPGSVPFFGQVSEAGMIAQSFSSNSSIGDPLELGTSGSWFYFHGTQEYVEFSAVGGVPFDLLGFDLGSNGFADRWLETSASTGQIALPTNHQHIHQQSSFSFSGPEYEDLQWFRVGTPFFATQVDNVSVSLPPPVAGFAGSPTSGEAPLTVAFSDLSQGAVELWDWSFGDGTFSSLQDPVHVYTAPGLYSVTLEISGPGGNAAKTEVDYILVTDPPPVADFGGMPRSGLAPLTVAFTDLSANAVDAWAWDFGDGASSVARNPVHEYATPGLYTVGLQVTGPGGNDAITKPGYILVLEGAPDEPTAECDDQADCDDGDPCTVDVCTSEGCFNTSVPDCPPDDCPDEVCDDLDPCTLDFCVEGVCVHWGPLPYDECLEEDDHYTPSPPGLTVVAPWTPGVQLQFVPPTTSPGVLFGGVMPYALPMGFLQTGSGDFAFPLASLPNPIWELLYAGDFPGSVQVGFSYDESLLLPGVDEENLIVYQSVDDTWVPLDSSVDTANDQITVVVDGFGVFALGRPAWNDMGSALAGVSGAPLLIGSGVLAEGELVELDLSRAAPSATAGLFLGFSGGAVPFKGGTLLPFPFLPPVLVPTSAAGTIPLAFVMPPGLPPGTELWAQWAIRDAAAVFGVALSNAVMEVAR